MRRRLGAFLTFAFILAFGAGACGQEIEVEQQEDGEDKTTVEQQQKQDQPQQNQQQPQEGQEQPQQEQPQQQQEQPQQQQEQPQQEKEKDGAGVNVDI